MPTALHPETQMTFKFDGQILPTKFGVPNAHPHPDQARLQEPQACHRTCVLNNYTGGHWEDNGYNWFSGL
jgi:DMSO/TMAO reductase YedYZ molybdopterin-dependent catalytic subunit